MGRTVESTQRERGGGWGRGMHFGGVCVVWYALYVCKDSVVAVVAVVRQVGGVPEAVGYQSERGVTCLCAVCVLRTVLRAVCAQYACVRVHCTCV
jgi:hypothetical protein